MIYAFLTSRPSGGELKGLFSFVYVKESRSFVLEFAYFYVLMHIPHYQDLLAAFGGVMAVQGSVDTEVLVIESRTR